VERLERALALFMVVAWRIARLMRLGRTCPDLDAALLFERDEWQAAYILNRKKVPKTPPRLNEVVRLVAMLGGFLARKGDGEPGVKSEDHLAWPPACRRFRRRDQIPGIM
jgi:hypothetical protein